MVRTQVEHHRSRAIHLELTCDIGMCVLPPRAREM